MGRFLGILAAISALWVVAAFAAFAWRPPIAPVARPAAKDFSAAQIERGAALAALGACWSCHTANGGAAFAGGLAIATPFGTIYSTNITPDEVTGIGRWSEAAFRRALREGVDRDGGQLYPAFPYDHFTLLTDEDIGALYAFLMTRPAIAATAPANTLKFPVNIRLVVAGWKLLFLRAGPYTPDPGKSDALNRGAYLVEGIAHCGACHTPRNAFGAEQYTDAFGGGDVEGWTAYALDGKSPAPIPWSTGALLAYLRNGWEARHGVAAGPMAPVMADLAAASDADIEAIADYLTTVRGPVSPDRERQADALVMRARDKPAQAVASPQGAGALIYQSACAACHDSGRPLPYGGINLGFASGPSGPDARDVANVVLWGLPAASGERAPIMPGFADVMSDRQLAALLIYMRTRFSDQPPWASIDQDIRAARSNRPVVWSAPGRNPAVPAVKHEARR